MASLMGTISGASAEASTNWQLADGGEKAQAPDLANFGFTVGNKTHLLYNSKDSSLLGNKSAVAHTMIANFTVSNVTSTAAFTYGGPARGGPPPSVRLYFDSVPPGSKSPTQTTGGRT